MNASKDNANASVKAAIGAGVFLAAFLLGSVPMWLAGGERVRERDRTQIELRGSRPPNSLVAVEARGGEYASARRSANELYTNRHGEIERGDDPAFAAAICACDEARQFIGYRHKGVKRGERLPNGAKDLGGGLLSDENYGVSRFSNGKKFMLWLEKIIDRDEEGVPSWEVTDALVFEKLKKNQKFLFSYSSPCTENGAENLDLIVLAKTPSRNKTYLVLKAWRADVEREKFQSVSTLGIVCR